MENQFKSIRQAELNRFALLIRIIIFLFVGNGDAFYSASCIHKLDLTILLKLVTWLLWQLSIWYFLLTIMADFHQLDIACPSTELNWFVADCWWMSILDCLRAICNWFLVPFHFHSFLALSAAEHKSIQNTSSSSVATLRTAIHLLLTYLLTYKIRPAKYLHFAKLLFYITTDVSSVTWPQWIESNWTESIMVNRLSLISSYRPIVVIFSVLVQSCAVRSFLQVAKFVYIAYSQLISFLWSLTFLHQGLFSVM